MAGGGRRVLLPFFLLSFTVSLYFFSVRVKKRHSSAGYSLFYRGDAVISLTEETVHNVRFLGWSLGMPHLGSHKIASSFAFLRYALTGDLIMAGMVRSLSLNITLPSRGVSAVPNIGINRISFASALTIIPRSSDLSRHSKMFYREIEEGAAKS